ncbi:MAG: hypothetical protein ACRD3Q_05670 [Terriglobales bacterium]
MVAATRLLEEHARTAHREDTRHWFTIATTVVGRAYFLEHAKIIESPDRVVGSRVKHGADRPP